MKTVIVSTLALLTISSSAFATNLKFMCETDQPIVDKKIHKVAFGILNMEDTKTRELVSPKGDREDEQPVKVIPKHSPLAALSENWQIRTGKDRIELFGDSDGFYLVYLDLFKSAQFRRGFVRINDISNTGIGNQYSTVTCKVGRL